MFQEDGAIRVIEGVRKEGDDVALDGEFDLEPDAVKAKFKKFVREFAYNTPGTAEQQQTLKYREQFELNCHSGFYRLQIDLGDLSAHEDGEVLAHKLQSSPTEFVPLCEAALQDLYNELVASESADSSLPAKAPAIQLQFTCDANFDGNFGSMKPQMIRSMNSDEVEKLVVLQGIVVSVKRGRHKARKVALRCRACENMKTIEIKSGFCAGHIPSACDGNSLHAGQLEKCPPNPFVVVSDLCEYIDEQVLRVQELPEHVPVGDMPRSLDVYVSSYLVDECTPGSRLTIIGIFCATEFEAGGGMSGNRGKGTNTVKYSYVQALGVKVAQGNSAQIGMDITPEEEEKFLNLAKDNDIRDKIYNSIAPSICASKKDVIEDVKKAVGCMLFGGSRKRLADGTRMRGDTNILLLGDPGTAKSQFLKFAEKVAPVAVYTSGKGSSAAGLTASIVRESGGGFTLEGGAMVLADGGIVCIDEFDKMDEKDRVAIHEAMEQQTISIAKAGITTMLNTQCSVLAAANPRFGTYDDLQSTADQMDFETTILSRFDMIFLVRDTRDPDRDFDLAKHMAGLHTGEVEESREGPLSVAELRKYLSFARSRCQPRLGEDAAEVLKNHYISIRAAMRGDASGKSAIPITVRQLEAIIRISESLAKMEMREDVTVAHVEEALRLFTVSTLDSANKDRGVGVETLAPEEREELAKAEEQIRKLVPRGGRKSKMQLESLLVSAGGVDERTARRAINRMMMSGDLKERNSNTLQREK
jgi:DNA replication licensing factor MCM5